MTLEELNGQLRFSHFLTQSDEVELRVRGWHHTQELCKQNYNKYYRNKSCLKRYFQKSHKA